MTSNATRTRAPIGAVRMGTIGFVGVIVAVGVPAVAAAIVMSSQVSEREAVVGIDAAGPVSRIVVADSDSDVRIVGDAAAKGVSGQAVVQWKGGDGGRPVLRQSFSGGVLTLTKDCSGGGCGPIDITVSVPRGVSVQAVTSEGNIALSGVTGLVDLVSSGGSIDADGLGSANASFRTIDGAIDASFTGAPARIVAETTNASVTIGTDGRTAYYDAVHTTNGVESLTNVQDRTSADEIDVTTTNGDVTIS
jgi:hypothetical protein